MSRTKNSLLIKSASYFSVLTAFVIMMAKLYGWAMTDSQSILASLIDALLDISSSMINLIAIHIALKPPDNEHRFGHEKFQDLAIFSQSIFFFASCLFMVFSSIKRLYLGASIENINDGINVMYFSTVLALILVIYQSYVVKKTNSKIIAADKLHYFTDLLANIVVIISLYLSESFWFIDPLAGIAIAIYITHAAYQLFRDALRNLVDQEFPQRDKNKILKIISKYSEVKGVHELKTRYAGSKPFIQFHLELDGDMSLIESHAIADEIEEELMNLFPLAEIMIHQDPEGLENNVKYREKI